MLFGKNADTSLQATFKVIKNDGIVITDSDVKLSIIQAINEYFAIDNWTFGDTFFYTELATYIHNALAPKISSIVIVPNKQENAFGSLFQVESNSDEIFISGATVDNVEVIDAVTASRLKASGKVLTVATSTNSGIQSAGTYTSGTVTSSSGSKNV